MSREMKDSGVEWIGNIPCSWKTVKAKRIFCQRSEKGNSISEQLLSPTQKYGVIPQALYEKLTSNRAVKLKADTDFNLLKTIHKNDYCISLRSFQGGFEYSTYEGVVSPAYQVFYAKKEISYIYFKYMFKSIPFIDKMNSYTLSLRDGKNISFENFANSLIPVPPLSEQQKIADFLDEKVKEIDNAIEKTKETIELYKKYKQALIDKMCIHGFDEKEASSNIEYFNKIPIRWSVMKCSYIFYESVSSPKKSDISLSLSQIDGVIPTKEMKESSLKTSTYDNWKHVDKNDLVLNRFKGHLGVIFSSKYEGMVSFHYGVYKSKYSINSKFFEYLFHTSNYKKVLSMQSNGMTVGLQNLSNSNFYSIKLLVPSLDVQNKITKYLDEKSKKINNLINAKQKIINELELYKKSLIYEYVTGKKEVK